jgi:ribosomal protein S18 acetylase RimI-like enzyme
MNFIIKEINQLNKNDVNKCNGEFLINSIIHLNLSNDNIEYQIEKVPEYNKKYSKDKINADDYINNDDKIIFFAYVEGKIAGQIILRKNWNKYAYIEDIVVDKTYRQIGIGKALISKAKEWAKDKELKGIMLETQNNNVAGCKLYESCGFKLCGFDKYLYKGIDSNTKEIALYWYYMF